MEKVPFDLNALSKEAVEEQVYIDLLRQFEECLEEHQVLENQDGEEDEEIDDDYYNDPYKDLVFRPIVKVWSSPDSDKIVPGVTVRRVPPSTDCKPYELDLCPICSEPWTLDKLHQMSCLPCGHIFGMSCLKRWMGKRSSALCPECYKRFSLEGVRLLYVTNLSIPAATYQKGSFNHYSFSKTGFINFKSYERTLRTNAVNNRSQVLKQRTHLLGRQNDAIKRRTNLLNRIAEYEKRADVLERQNDAIKRELLNRRTDEEEWAEASEEQAYAEKWVEALRRKAGALRKSADECLCKAYAFGKQAKSLRQEAKSLGRLVDSYLASRKFYIQSYKEFLGLHDNKITE